LFFCNWYNKAIWSTSFLLVFTVYGYTFCSAQNTVTQEPVSVANTDTIVLDLNIHQDITFDTLKQDTIIQKWFTFTNPFNKPIILDHIVTGDGGCYAEHNNRIISGVQLVENEVYTFYLRYYTSTRRGKIVKRIQFFFRDDAGEEMIRWYTFGGIIQEKK
jgi:hypothetical protein